MLAQTFSVLEGSVIAVVSLWLMAVLFGGILRIAVSTSLKSLFPGKEGADRQFLEKSRAKLRAGYRVFNIVVTTMAILTVTVFVLFLNNRNAKPVRDLPAITAAPLPANFQPPTAEAIERSNEKAVTEDTVKANQQATESNTKAMNQAINLFKRIK